MGLLYWAGRMEVASHRTVIQSSILLTCAETLILKPPDCLANWRNVQIAHDWMSRGMYDVLFLGSRGTSPHM